MIKWNSHSQHIYKHNSTLAHLYRLLIFVNNVMPTLLSLKDTFSYRSMIPKMRKPYRKQCCKFNNLINNRHWILNTITQRSKITHIIPKTLRTFKCQSSQTTCLYGNKHYKNGGSTLLNLQNMKQSLQNDYHNGSRNWNPPHTTTDLKQKSSCLHLESETPLSFYNNPLPEPMSTQICVTIWHH